MGKKDIITKNYIRRPEIFADIFNYRLYGGKDRIQPDQLKEMDIAESLVTNQKGNGGRFGKAVTVEKYRDIKKIFREGCYRCLILGVEEQDKIHYAMPVRTFMYDAMAYHKQVDNIRKEHRKRKDYTGHSQEEFLSDFFKEDKIIPVITVVLYFGEKPWDGPRSLKDMMGWKGEEAEPYIQDYKMNLLIPSEIKDAEIETLQSSLREVFYFLKYAGDWKKLEKILDKNERFRSLEKEAAVVISTLTNTEIKIKESEEKQDMCEAIEQMKQESMEMGLEKGLEKAESKIIINMYRKGYNCMQITDITGVEEEKVREIIRIKEWETQNS